MSNSTHSTHIDFEIDEDFCNYYLQQFEARCKTEERVRMSNLTQKTQEKFIEQILLKHYSANFTQDGTMPDPREILPTITHAADNVSARYNAKPRNCLITINPRKEISLDKLKTAVERFRDKAMIERYFYVYEVRKGEEGLHCHMLATYSGRPNNFSRTIKTAFKEICDASNNHILNIKFINDELMPDKIQYLLGVKKKAKQSGVKDTIEFRKKHSLSQYYESIPPLSCRDTQLTIIEIEE